MVMMAAGGRWLCARQYFKQFTSVLANTAALRGVRARVCAHLFTWEGVCSAKEGCKPAEPLPPTCFVSALKPSSW